MPHDYLVCKALDERLVFKNERPTILVSLQWGLGEHYYTDTKSNYVMCGALSKIIKKTHQNYNWMLRLHPVQLHGIAGRETREYLDQEFGQLIGVEWEESSCLPLPVVLQHSQLHITDMSTVVTEAAWYGIPSAILNPFVRPGERIETLFKEEREIGVASLVKQTESDIEGWIVSALKSRHRIQTVEPEESLLEFLREVVYADDAINYTNN